MYDDDSYGCFGTILAFTLLIWLAKIVGIIALILLVVVAIVFGVRTYKNKTVDNK